MVLYILTFTFPDSRQVASIPFIYSALNLFVQAILIC
jgi:hypothetical protein